MPDAIRCQRCHFCATSAVGGSLMARRRLPRLVGDAPTTPPARCRAGGDGVTHALECRRRRLLREARRIDRTPLYWREP